MTQDLDKIYGLLDPVVVETLVKEVNKMHKHHV